MFINYKTLNTFKFAICKIRIYIYIAGIEQTYLSRATFLSFFLCNYAAEY